MNERRCPSFTEGYTVRRGDTVTSIAAAFNTTPLVIQFLNPFINLNRIRVGEIICVPRRAETPPCPNGVIYTIRAGDTFYRIAEENNITVRELQRANPLVNPFSLAVGQRICIPRPEAPPAPPPCPGGVRYTIRAGDTFFSIANQNNITVRELQQANPGVDPTRLVVGQIICIPRRVTPPPTPACPGGSFYTVRAGDTYFRIADQFNITVRELEVANPGVDPTRLFIGQILCIPRRVTPPTPRCPGGKIHVVVQGDTLFRIARQYDITFQNLIDANPDLSGATLRIGQEICIPPFEPTTLCPNGRYYVIKEGDTIASIARMFSTNRITLLRLNPQMAPSEFVPGRRICVPPAPATTGTVEYEIEEEEIEE